MIVSVTMLGIYISGYVMARQASWVVHRTGFYTDANQQMRVAEHAVVAGDFGMPALAPKTSTAQAIVVAAYMPARALEKIIWSVVVPAGAQWPSDWDNKEI